MGSDEYRKALDAAEAELEKLDRTAELIEQRRAQLQQTVSALKTLMNVSEQEERTLTDAIRISIKASNNFIEPFQILQAVRSMGIKFTTTNPISSLTTILHRLEKAGEIKREGAGYRWIRRVTLADLGGTGKLAEFSDVLLGERITAIADAVRKVKK